MAWLLTLILQDFDTQELDFDYIDHVRIEDLNGDGRKDLIVQSGFDLKLYFQTDQGRYGPQPDRTVRFDDRTFLWMLRPNDKNRFDLASIHTMTSRGIHRIKIHDGAVEVEDLVVHPTVFEGRSTSSHPPPYQDFSPDFTGDGKPDLVLFTREFLFLMAQENGSWVLRHKIECGNEPGIPQWVMSYTPQTWSLVVPRFIFGDVNGDQRPDFMYYMDEELTIALQDANCRFAVVDQKVLLSRRKHKRKRGLVSLEVPPVVEDYTGDKLIDVAYTEVSRGRVYLRYGIKDRSDFTDPQEREIPSSWNLATQFVDLEGKGSKRMVLWVVPKLGLSSGIEAFVSKKVTINGFFFDSGKDGGVSQTARAKVSLSIPFTVYLTRNTTEIPVDLLFEPNFEGDINEDGIKDLLVAVGPSLHGWYGHPEQIISSEPDFKLTLNPPTSTAKGRLHTALLNGDKKADIVIVHSDVVSEKARIEIKLSK